MRYGPARRGHRRGVDEITRAGAHRIRSTDIAGGRGVEITEHEVLELRRHRLRGTRFNDEGVETGGETQRVEINASLEEGTDRIAPQVPGWRGAGSLGRVGPGRADLRGVHQRKRLGSGHVDRIEGAVTARAGRDPPEDLRH